MNSAKTLGALRTDLGDRSTYDAVSQCSRCGYCEQACPTYVVTGEESKSGRGRNQVVRMLLERKFKDPSQAEESLATCLLCGACTTACYAHVPTADLVLEGRRMLRGGRPHWLVRVLGELLENRPRLLARLLKAANFFKRIGLSRPVSEAGVFRLLGLRGLEEAERHVDEAPDKFLFEYLREDRDLLAAPGASDPSAPVRWAYFAPCGPNYLFPRVGRATVSVLKASLGRGIFLDNPCCGLLAYNYGDLEAARRLARRNIENGEALSAESGAATERAPIFGDCSSCVAHLKSYPQMFLDDGAWKSRAEAFARRVRDIAELAPRKKNVGCESPEAAGAGVWTYHDACRARNGQGVAAQPRQLLEAGGCSAYRELPEAGWCCGGAGAFAFTQPELSEQVLRRKIGHIASIQAREVVTSSTSCLIQIAGGLKKYYPECGVIHVSERLAARLKNTGSTHG